MSITIPDGINLGLIEVDGEKYTEISGGDDGQIIKFTNGDQCYAIKIFHVRTSREGLEGMRKIAYDMACREYLALKLLTGHPNVPLLFSSGIDQCQLKMDGYTEHASYCIRISFLERIYHLNGPILRDIGLTPTSDNLFEVNFEQKNTLSKYLLGQAASIAMALKAHGIFHRDLVENNFQVQLPELRLYIFDFACSDIQGLRPMLEIHDEALEEEKALKAANVSRDDVRYDVILRKKKYSSDAGVRKFNTSQFKMDPNEPEVQDRDTIFFWVSEALWSVSINPYYISQIELFKSTLYAETRQKFLTSLETLMLWATPPIKELQIYSVVYHQAIQENWARLPIAQQDTRLQFWTTINKLTTIMLSNHPSPCLAAEWPKSRLISSHIDQSTEK